MLSATGGAAVASVASVAAGPAATFTSNCGLRMGITTSDGALVNHDYEPGTKIDGKIAIAHD